MRSLHAPTTVLGPNPSSRLRPILLSTLMGFGLLITTLGIALGAALGVALVLDLLR